VSDYNAADRKSVRAAQKSAKQADNRRKEVVAELMSTINGREYAWAKLSEASIFTTTFTGDPLTSAFNEGVRSAGLALLADIMTACPDQFTLAMRENNERANLSQRPSSQDSDGGTGGPDSEADGDADS
jgi:hypothetical protein